MIFDVFKHLHGLVKVKEVNIYYNVVFTMHTKFTVIVLLCFAILVSAQEYFGNPINCKISDSREQSFAETNCWIHGTFTVRKASKIVDGKVTLEDVREYQKYYQWISIVLMIQAILFYTPAYLWRSWERGRIRQLCRSLGSPLLPEQYERQKYQIVAYLSNDNSRMHGVYVLRFVVCEILNFLTVIVNMWMLNGIFHRFWTRYLPVVWALFTADGEVFSSLASDLFPKLAKCGYKHVGPSGSEQNLDALCILPLNVLNEKIFAFLYVWFVLLAIVSGCNLMTRSVVLLSSGLRLKMIRTLAMSSEPLTKRHLQIILRGDNIGDWFVLYSLGRNLNSFVFREILEDLASGRTPLNNKIQDTVQASQMRLYDA